MVKKSSSENIPKLRPLFGNGDIFNIDETPIHDRIEENSPLYPLVEGHILELITNSAKIFVPYILRREPDLADKDIPETVSDPFEESDIPYAKYSIDAFSLIASRSHFVYWVKKDPHRVMFDRTYKIAIEILRYLTEGVQSESTLLAAKMLRQSGLPAFIPKLSKRRSKDWFLYHCRENPKYLLMEIEKYKTELKKYIKPNKNLYQSKSDFKDAFSKIFKTEPPKYLLISDRSSNLRNISLAFIAHERGCSYHTLHDILRNKPKDR